MTIRFPSGSLFHALSHFQTLDDRIRQELIDSGYSEQQIVGQLQLPGSKFKESFACSPQEAVGKLQQSFPEIFTGASPDADGRIHLSFVFAEYIGSTKVISESELTTAEAASLRVEDRNGYLVRTVQVQRDIPTCECQLILTAAQEECDFCTIFPGETAPPLPHCGKPVPPYWRTHVFIR